MISKRLNMILQNVTKIKVADIGTDHAYIPIELAKGGAKVIATDISHGPLQNAEKNVKKYNLDISLRLGGGLEPLTIGEADEIIIAGMGGEMIEKIISNDIEKAKSARLLLQPMNSQAELRSFLIKNGFTILKEDLAQEGHKIYNLILCEKGSMQLPKSETDLHLPKELYNHPLFPMLLAKKKREFLKRYNGLKNSKTENKSELLHLQALIDDTEKIEKGELL